MTLQQFIAQLEAQVQEQMKVILRFRDLHNDTADEELKDKYQQEVDRRRQNIREIREDLLTDFQLMNDTPEANAAQVADNVVAKAEKALDNLEKISAKLAKQAEALPEDLTSILQALKEDMLADNKENTLALADQIITSSHKRDDIDLETQQLIQEIQSSGSVEAKIKLAIPLLKAWGIDFEIEAKKELLGIFGRRKK